MHIHKARTTAASTTHRTILNRYKWGEVMETKPPCWRYTQSERMVSWNAKIWKFCEGYSQTAYFDCPTCTITCESLWRYTVATQYTSSMAAVTRQNDVTVTPCIIRPTRYGLTCDKKRVNKLNRLISYVNSDQYRIDNGGHNWNTIFEKLYPLPSLVTLSVIAFYSAINLLPF